MAVNLSPVGGVAAQFFDNSGNPLTGGKLYTYTAGTTTPAATYTSSSGVTAHPNPIVLDAAGRVPNSGEVWLTDGLQYKFVLKTSADVLIATYDNIVGINSNFINFTNEQEIQTATAGQTVFTLTTMQYQPGTNSLSVFVDGVNQYGPGAQYAFLETDSTTVTFISGLHVGAEVKFTTSAINASSYGDAFQISYTPPFTASVPTNVGDKLAQTVSVKDFGAVGDGIVDDTAAIQNAIDYAVANGIALLVPSGIFNISDTLNIPDSATPHYANFCLFGESSSPLATYGSNVAVGSVIKMTDSEKTAIQTPQLSAPNNTIAYWQQNIVIRNLQIWGTKTYNSSFSVAEQNAVGLNLSYALYVQVENVNVQGFGVGIQHINVAEVNHTGLTALTNNYIGLWLENKDNTDCQVTFNALQINYNGNRDMYCKSARSIYVRSGECVTGYDAGVTDQARIVFDTAAANSIVEFKNFHAENHQDNKPLVQFINSTVFGSLTFSNCDFESFVNDANPSAKNNPLVATGGAYFDVLKVSGCQFDRQVDPGNPSDYNPNPVVLINDYTDASNDGVYKNQVIIENSSPNWYDVAYVDYRTITSRRAVILPPTYVNAIQVDNKIFFDALYQTSVYDALGDPQTTGTPTWDGSYRIWWNSTTANNYATITCKAAIKSSVFIVYICVDDNNGTVIPEIYDVFNVGPSPDYSVSRVRVQSVTIGTRVYGKYMYTICAKLKSELEANAITGVQLSNIYGGVGLNTTGLESFAMYAPSEYVTSNNLTDAKVTAAPVSGSWGLGEVLFYRAPTAGGYIGTVNTVSTLAGGTAVWKDFGAIVV